MRKHCLSIICFKVDSVFEKKQTLCCSLDFSAHNVYGLVWVYERFTKGRWLYYSLTAQTFNRVNPFFVVFFCVFSRRNVRGFSISSQPRFDPVRYVCRFVIGPIPPFLGNAHVSVGVSVNPVSGCYVFLD